MTTASLRDKPVRDLARLAKQHGVQGWHSMRKDQLIRALVRKAKSALPEAGLGAVPRAASKTATPQSGAATPATSPEVAQRIAEARQRLAKAKDLATKPETGRAGRPLRDRMHSRHAPLPFGVLSLVARPALSNRWLVSPLRLWRGRRPGVRLTPDSGSTPRSSPTR